MTIQALRRLGQRVRYKPGWQVTVHRGFKAPAEILLTAAGAVPDSDGSGRRFHVSFTEFIPIQDAWKMDQRAALRMILRLFDRAERHETREFLRVGRARPFDPHRRPTR